MRGGLWIGSYVVLWVTTMVLALAVVALLRQIGVLHTRLRPLGVHPAGEGPDHLAPAPSIKDLDYSASQLTLLAFTSPACTICASLVPSLRALDHQYADIRLQVVDHGPTTISTFEEFNVRSTPFFVAVDRDGIVRARGVANTLEQVEVMVAGALAETDV